jgi:hypothetical protein
MPKFVRFWFICSLIWWALFGCQGRGKVQETPPPRYPAQETPEVPSAKARAVLPEAAPTDDSDVDARAQGWPAPASATPPAPSASEDKETESWRGQAPGASGAATPSRSRPGAEKAERRDNSRPGLATHWGETRYSPAREVDFERARYDQPTLLSELHYNDRDGALAMLPGGTFGRSERTLLGGALRISMLDASGRPFTALCQGGRIVSMGEPGERYSLLIENRASERYEVVTTVDGLDVLDGEDGSLVKRGYLIGAYGSAIIDGFRRSEQQVAAFRLGDVRHSYANSKGKARNVGVIGFALFAERQHTAEYPSRRYPVPAYPSDTTLRQTAEPFPGRFARPPAW